MTLSDYVLAMVFIGLLGIVQIFTAEKIEKQQIKIEQLTERVLLLENALADQTGIKK